MTALYLDIETIPTQRQDVCDYLSTTLRDDTLKAMEAVCAPANYKDADKIAEYIATKKAALQDEFAAKLKEKIDATGLDGSFGQVWSQAPTIALTGAFFTCSSMRGMLSRYPSYQPPIRKAGTRTSS